MCSSTRAVPVNELARSQGIYNLVGELGLGSSNNGVIYRGDGGNQRRCNWSNIQSSPRLNYIADLNDTNNNFFWGYIQMLSILDL